MRSTTRSHTKEKKRKWGRNVIPGMAVCLPKKTNYKMTRTKKEKNRKKASREGISRDSESSKAQTHQENRQSNTARQLQQAHNTSLLTQKP